MCFGKRHAKSRIPRGTLGPQQDSGGVGPKSPLHTWEHQSCPACLGDEHWEQQSTTFGNLAETSLKFLHGKGYNIRSKSTFKIQVILIMAFLKLSHHSGWWFGTWLFFSISYMGYIWDVILPIDELIFFRGVGWNHQAAFIFVAETCFQDSIPFLPGFCTGHQLHRELQDLEFKEDGSGKAPKFDSWSCANFG